MTRFKIVVINAVIVVGAVAIAVLQWPHAREVIGSADDIGGAILLEVLIAGIPIVLWAAAAHFGLSWLVMRHGELEEYRARQEIARLPQEPQEVKQPPSDLID